MYLETIILTVFLHAKSITRVPCRPRNRKLRISRHFPMARRYLSLDTAHLAVCSPGKVGYFPLERCSGRISFAWREVFSFLCHSHRVVLAFSRYILNVTRDFAHQSREFAFWGSSSDTTLQRLRSLQFSTYNKIEVKKKTRRKKSTCWEKERRRHGAIRAEQRQRGKEIETEEP